MDPNAWYDKGISKENYISRLDKHKENFQTVYNHFKIPEQDIPTLKEKKGIRAIVLAEVWCGHCMMDVPILLHILETANIPVSFLPRDEHLELMDQYTTNGKRIIPIFIFIDADGNELGKWGPMSPEVEQLNNQIKKSLPSKEDPHYKETFSQMASEMTERFTKESTYWHSTYESIMKTLS